MKFVLILPLLFTLSRTEYYEKFFEIDGGPKYMYYFAKFQVGNPPSEQSAIIDTGSDTFAFPCDICESGDCGEHQDPRYIMSKSKTFGFKIDCSSQIEYKSNKVCQFVKSYAEGSSLYGIMGFDYIKFKNSHKIDDQRLKVLNENLMKQLQIKAEFGCTTKETGLFKTQYADGILGLDNNSSLIQSIEKDYGKNKGNDFIFNFGLCFHQSGGIMSVDLRNEAKDQFKITFLEQNYKDKPFIELNYRNIGGYYEVKLDKFRIENDEHELDPINLMFDSGTTFSHFPTSIVNKVLKTLNDFCDENKDKCGKLENANFDVETCLELKQPDDNYKSVEELLDSFPNIQLFFEGQD